MTKYFTLAIGILFSVFSYGQRYSWNDSAEPKDVDRQIVPEKYRTIAVDFQELKTTLLQAPNEQTVSASESPFIIELPHPDGGNWLFSVVESSVMAPELQAKFPEIRTFLGQGRGEYAHAIVRMDFTPKGFHAQVLMAGNSYYIDPYAPGIVDVYICYTRQDFYKSNVKTFPKCAVDEHNSIPEGPFSPVDREKQNTGKPGKGGDSNESKTTNGTTLRAYDLALACTGEYAQFHGGTVPDAMAAMVTSMNRVNGVFERDMSLRMIMVPNNDNLIFLDPNNDPYNNGSGGDMLGENISTCNSVIGISNYDIGHVYSTGGGGVAYLESVCKSFKAGGVTGQGSPIGDPFDIDYVAHEMGHQWGGNHTQNNDCNRSTNAAYEPGSASTIMGYAGICAPNLQSNSDDHFHNHSFNEMYNYSVAGFGNSCASSSGTGNTPPTVTIPAGGFFIPISTPFELTASASDVNGDLLTYCWEQYDLGPETSGGDNDLTNPSGTAPIFRSWSPTTDDTRVFPRIEDLVNNTTVIGEHLPTYTRDLTFRCTVRDNRAGGGGVTDEEIAFEATNNAGPFLVTAPNTATTWTGGTTTTVNWDVANTNNSPVNCSNVDIFLSLDGGFTYPQTLASNVPNNGSASVTVPNISTSQARVKVKAANNIFFDISNQDFTIASGCAGIPVISNVSPTTYNCGGGESMTISGANFCSPVSVTVDGNNAAISSSSESQITVTMPGGSGTVDIIVTSSFGSSTASQVSYAAPLIASVAPTTLSCAGGTTLTVIGSNFCSATAVTVGENNASNLIQVSSTQLIVTAPAGSGTNVSVQVTTPSGTSNVSLVDYAAPLIASVAPTTLSCAGGATLTISGSEFCSASSVTVGGVVATVLSITASEIQVTAPAGSGTNVPVQVTTPSGTSNVSLVDYAAPLIASVAPTTLSCAGGATLTISGSEFCSASSVTVGGVVATVLSNTASEIQVTAPAGSGTNVPVQVTTPSGISNVSNVDYAAPLIASVAPTTLECAGGATLTITGSNFCSASSVTVGGEVATVLSNTASEIQITTPSGSGTNVPIQVTTPSGTSNVSNVDYAAPLIASVAPTTLDCAGGASLTITGSNFCDATSVTVGGNGAPILGSSATQIVATVPPGSGTNVAVQVTTPSGTSNLSNVDYAAPLIASVAPSTLECAGGATLTITGSNFCDATSVTVGGNSATNLIEVSSTQILVTAPAGSGTNVAVQVTTPSGTSNLTNVDYAAPLIASVAPTTLECAGGATLTITGSNFCSASSVTVGGEVATVLSNTASEIQITTPSGSGTNVPIQVTTPSGTSNLSNVDYAAPLIASVAPTTLECAGGQTLTLIGSNFCDATSVTVGGNSATNLIEVSSSQILVTSPAGSGTNVAVQVTTPSGQSMAVDVDYEPCGPVCVAGEYNDNGTCTVCPPGFYCPGDGNSYPCPAGEFSSTSGAESCQPCAAGFYSGTVASTSCQPCEAGSFSGIIGATECMDCPAGTSQGAQGQASCDACPVGTYSSITGAISCEVCPAGTFNNQIGQIQCTDCAPGSFSSIEGSTECSLCPSDTYSDTAGSIECLDCPEGSNSDPGSVSCEPCSIDVVSSAESATPGFANGSASVVASGGQEPYSFQWNDSFLQTTATAVGLFPGTYTCTVTDAQNCTEEIIVEVPLFTGIPLTQVSSPYCNTGGYALSDFIACIAVQNADAYRWELVVQGGSALPEYTRFNNKYLRIQWVNGTQPGVTYEVRVKARVSGEWGDYGQMCTIATSPNVPTTELRPEYHPTNNSGQNYAMCDFAIAYGVANATNYRWRFDPDSDPNNGNEIIYTRGIGNPATRLSWVNGLAPGNTYFVAVSAEIGGTWGDYGVVHSIDLDAPNEPVIRPAFCNQTIAPSGYVLSTSVCAANYYQFQFEPVGGGQLSTRTSGNYVCFLSGVSPSLAPGDYNVRVRINQGGVIGAYGEPCVITIAGPQNPLGGIELKSVASKSAAIIFPNPGDGTNINIQLDLESDGSHTVHVKLFNAYGQQIGFDQFNVEGKHFNGQLAQDIPLVSGLYFVEVVTDDKRMALVKMVVQ